MKSNAIIRIITWSLVILVLLAILTAGLGFRGISLHWRWDDDDDPAETAIPQQVEPTEAHVYMETTFYAAESINIHEKPSEQSKIKSVIQPGDTVHLGQDQLINDQHWGYITAPGAGWILLEDDAEASLPAETEAPLSLNYKVNETTNIRATPSPDGKVLGVVEAGERVNLVEDMFINGLNWGRIKAPEEGWIQLTNPKPEATVPANTEPAAVEPTIDPNSSAAITRGYEYNATDVSEISIDWAAGTIRIVPVEGNRITVEETGNFDRYPMEIKQKNGKLSISYSDKKSIIGIHVDFSKDLTIQVPKGFQLQELDIDAASTTVLVQDLTIREAEFDGASGICEFVNCNVDQLDIDTASGDIRFSGSLKELDCDAASASFIAELVNVPHRMEMDSMSGNLDVTLPEDAGFTVRMEGMSSDFSSDFDTTSKNGVHSHGDGACRIQMEALSGDVIIRKVK